MEYDRIICADNMYTPTSYSIHTYNRYIKQFIDCYNWGCSDEFKTFCFRKDTINDRFASHDPRRIRAMELKRDKHLRPHFDGDATVFYTSNPYSYIAMLTIDIDHVDGANPDECVAAAQLIVEHLHPGAYYEPSTGGRGIHLYILLNIEGWIPPPRFTSIRPRQFHWLNTYLDLKAGALHYSSLLNKWIHHKGVNCTIDRIKGTYPQYWFDVCCKARQLINRAQLCKVPRLDTEEKFWRFVQAPIYTMDDIHQNHAWLENALTCSNPTLPIIISDTIAEDNATQDEENETDKNKKAKYPTYTTNNRLGMKGGHGQNIGLCWEDLRSRDAVCRTIVLIQYLARMLKRLPTYAEWHDFYCRNGLNTGAETPRRPQRFKDCVEFVAATFDPKKCETRYRVGEFLDDIRTRLSDEDLKQLCAGFKSKITHEDLDVAMGCYWANIAQDKPDRLQFTVPVKGVIGWFRFLKRAGMHSRSCDKTKAKLLRTALQRIGYLDLLDPTVARGRAQRWIVGKAFPKYDEFVEMGLDVLAKRYPEESPDAIIKEIVERRHIRICEAAEKRNAMRRDRRDESSQERSEGPLSELEETNNNDKAA